MCGITGIFNFDSQSVNRELLTRMTRVLSHRGPDDEGVCAWDNVGFGHRRLSIIDLSERGRQPMSNEDGTVWITYNGEIYNHLALREKLRKKGHLYKSQTDTETIIHLYEEEGPDCLEHLEGEFAFSIWDANKKVVFCARDRLGVKPFYYHISQARLIFASEIKAILAHPELTRKIDSQALSHYLSFSVSPAPLTFFKDILKLEAGHYLLVSSGGKIVKRQYWDCVPKPKIKRAEPEATEAIRLKLEGSIRARLMSDVPFGVFLSGGIDSSANVAFMSRMMVEPVKTFNVAIEGSCGYDESYFAESVSRSFHAEYNSIRIDFEDFRGLFNNLAYYTDEPLCDYACIPNFYLAKLARQKGVSVIQVGEGSDELFCGYRSYAAILNLIKFYYPLPRLIKVPIFNLSRLILGERTHYAVSRAARNQEVFLGGSYLFNEEEKAFLFKKSFNAKGLITSEAYVSGVYRNLLNKFPQASPLDKMIYLDLKVRLPELLLMRADKMTMANSVEARLPFLDYQFVEYVLSLPDEYKYRHSQTKYIFKKSLEGILPREVIYRPKKGFAGSPLNLFGAQFQECLRQAYKSTEPLLAEYFDMDNFKVRLEFNRERMNFREGSKVWSLFSLMLWLERFLK